MRAAQVAPDAWHMSTITDAKRVTTTTSDQDAVEPRPAVAIIAVTPWDYVWQEEFRAPGDPWSRSGHNDGRTPA